MLPRRPYSGPRKLVLAFDIGTTYSGISYCILQPGQIPEIRGVTKFPGQTEGRGNAKVPSILYYDHHGNVKAIGSEALSMNVINNAEDKGWNKTEWWKLHLRPKHLDSTHIKDGDLPPLPPGKSAVDILTDFIKFLFKAAKTHIEEHHMGFVWTSIQDSIEFIFSHPNGWEGSQQQKYREAIEGAGLITRTSGVQSRVHMITEGEASLHYCLSTLGPDGFADNGPQAIAIIDAGGGTIDLSLYSVSFNPISCKEIAPAECRLQGSVFVTHRAVNLLRGKLDGSSHTNIEEMRYLAQKFDEVTKLSIRSADEPVYLTIGNPRYNNQQYNIKRGALKLSGEESTGLFNESIQAILNAFNQQCQNKVIDTKTTMAFLVGGMGTNDFVWAHLKSHFKGQGVSICRPDNDINKAVANGAVIFHIAGAVKSRVARATYGVSYSPWAEESNPEHRHRKNQWHKGPCGRYLIDGGFSPMLHRGEQVDEQKEIRQPFTFRLASKAEFRCVMITLLCYWGNLSDPELLDQDPVNFTEICTIKANLSGAAKKSPVMTGVSGEIYYHVNIEVIAFFGSTEFVAQVAWKDSGTEERTPARVIYYDN